MFRYKHFPIAAVLAAFMLISFVGNSHAIKIVDFPSDTENYSYNGYTYHMAYVETDVPIYYVSWSIDGENVHGETLDSSTNYASYFPYDKIPGIIKGKKYEIGVTVWEWDADAEEFRDTSASYEVRMFQSKSISGYKQPTWEKPRVTGVYGYVELTRHYHDGWNIVMEGNLNAENPTDEDCTGRCWFRHSEYKEENGILVGTGWMEEHTGPTEKFGPDQPNSWYGSHRTISSLLNYPVNTDDGNIGDTQVIILNAHIHLAVSDRWTTDVWHETNHQWTHWFRAADNKKK